MNMPWRSGSWIKSNETKDERRTEKVNKEYTCDRKIEASSPSTIRRIEAESGSGGDGGAKVWGVLDLGQAVRVHLYGSKDE
jgi:hypothetical protein